TPWPKNVGVKTQINHHSLPDPSAAPNTAGAKPFPAALVPPS
ncbi:hypothetical protein A2U01_0108467, partial [Trifolium medium]|nr:hypothetical protein [Trifolium medium]